MAWVGGTYTKPRNHQTDDTNGRAILSADLEENAADYTTGINDCLNASGQNAALGDLPMGGFSHTGVALGTSSDQYSRMDQVRGGSAQSPMWVSAVLSGGVAYQGDAIPAVSAYARGMSIIFYATSANTVSAPTLNVNSISAAVLRVGTSAVASAALGDGSIYTVVYDGSGWQVQTPL